MQNGDPARSVTHISQAYPDRVEVRGRDLCGELMGGVSFSQYFHLLLTGEEPTAEQSFFLDVLLVAIAEHGMMPTNVAARMTLFADPDALQGAVAAGILGAGPVILGTSEPCARLLAAAAARVAGRRGASRRSRSTRPVRSTTPAAACPASATRCTSRSTPAPSGSSSSRTHEASAACTSALARAFRAAAAEVWGKPLHAERLDADRGGHARPRLPGVRGEVVPILARTAGLLAHLAEERENPIGFAMAKEAEESVDYVPPAS